MEGHGQSEKMGAVSSPGERDWVKWSANEMEIFTDSWRNPAAAGMPLKRHSVIGRSRGSNTKGGKVARVESKKLEVAPKSISVDTGLE